MAAVYPETRQTDSDKVVIMPKSLSDTGATPEGYPSSDEGEGLVAPHSAITGLGDDTHTRSDDILHELVRIRALLTEIRDLAMSVKIPAFLKGKK